MLSSEGFFFPLKTLGMFYTIPTKSCFPAGEVSHGEKWQIPSDLPTDKYTYIHSQLTNLISQC